VFSRQWRALFTGTSASAPIFAAILNRIVEERLRCGKGPLGWVNPTLYQHPEVFNDITIGDNIDPKSCRGKGFKCAAGWDPVLGPRFALSAM
jgi:tripeptidyl-peptidase-1